MLMTRTPGARALDAWATHVTMKKGRPALTLHVLCRDDDGDKSDGGGGGAAPTGAARELLRVLYHEVCLDGRVRGAETGNRGGWVAV